jgi:hypothetical protein
MLSSLDSIQLYAARSNALSRVGARWYGLVYDNAPLIAFFVDDAWYAPALSAGLAIGFLEVGFFLNFTTHPAPASAL